MRVRVLSTGSSLDQRVDYGRRSTDFHEAVHGLLHDVSNEVATLSCLVDAVRGDPALPPSLAPRIELISQQLARLLGLVSNELLDEPPEGAGEAVDVRALADQMAEFASAAHMAEVVVHPGAPVRVDVSPTLLWRVLSNVVGNAARAAGPDGHVEVTIIRDMGDTVIDVTDDGPGFGNGPPGLASLGLRVVRSLLSSCGGTLAVQSPEAGGTRVRMVLPSQRHEMGATRASAQMSG